MWTKQLSHLQCSCLCWLITRVFQFCLAAGVRVFNNWCWTKWANGLSKSVCECVVFVSAVLSITTISSAVAMGNTHQTNAVRVHTRPHSTTHTHTHTHTHVMHFIPLGIYWKLHFQCFIVSMCNKQRLRQRKEALKTWTEMTGQYEPCRLSHSVCVCVCVCARTFCALIGDSDFVKIFSLSLGTQMSSVFCLYK